ncbi:MAG TPA: hypothetical protein VJU58_13705 [Microbacterium sp.]|nr:hypothetical protein [Microbacterium sp.]
MWVVAVAIIAGAAAPLTADRLRAPDGSVRDVPSESVDFAIKDGYTRIPKVLMRPPSSDLVYEIDEDQVALREAEGYWRMTKSEADAWRSAEYERRLDRIVGKARRETYGGVGGSVEAGLAGLARGATLTLSDNVLYGISGEQASFVLRQLREEHPDLSRVSFVVGFCGLLIGVFFAARRVWRWWLRGAVAQ